MPNFSPEQELALDSTVQTMPTSMPNQFGAVVQGTPTDPNVAPLGNPNDIVTNPSAIVDPALRAAYVADHPLDAPAPAPAPITAPVPAEPAPSVPTQTAPAAAPAAPVAVPGPGHVTAPPSTNPGGISDAAQTVIDNANRQQLHGEAQSNLAADTELKKQQAALTADQAKQEAVHAAETEKRVNEAVNWGNQYVQDAQNHVKAKQAEYEAALQEDKSHDVFTGKAPWQKAGAWLGLAVGAIGAGFSAAGGHPTGNQAVTTLDTIVQDDFNEQKARISNLKDSVAMALTGVKDANDAKQALMFDVLAKEKAAYATLETQAKAQAAGLGAKAADLEGSDLMTTLRQRQMDTDLAIKRQAQADALNKVKTYADINKNNAEASNARAMAEYHHALATGQVGPNGGVNINIKNEEKAATYADTLVNKDKRVLEARKKAGEVDSALNLLDQPKVDGVTFKGALDALYKSYTGAAARPQAIQSWLTSIGGTPNEVGRLMNHYADGSPTDQDVAAVKKLASRGKSIFDKEERTARAAIAEDAKTHPLIANNPAILERIRGKEAQPVSRDVVPKSGPYKGKTVTIDEQGNILKVR